MTYLHNLHYSDLDCRYISHNILEAEISGKRSHGLVCLLILKSETDKGNINQNCAEIGFAWNPENHLRVNGFGKTGYRVIGEALEQAMIRLPVSDRLSLGITNFGFSSGYIGAYARQAAENSVIFISFNKSPGGLVPYGAKRAAWGTNPLTIGIPGDKEAVILDMASSQSNWGELLLASILREKIADGTAVDRQGNPTGEPGEVLGGGGLLPFSGHKGSGLAFVNELLAFALLNSDGRRLPEARWGSFILLFNLAIFTNQRQFKKKVAATIRELKQLPKAPGVAEIYFPGELSARKRQENRAKGRIAIDDQLWQALRSGYRV